MNFGAVLGEITGFLDRKRHRYAVIGGVAMIMYGLPRTTLDLDLVVESSSQDDLVQHLESIGYQTLHRSSGYSNHSHSDPSRGSLDFVYVQGETSERLFADCRFARGPGGMDVPIPRPEHLAALKILAMKNDPGRTFQEMSDIRFLLALPRVDRQEIHSYFQRHGLEERFRDLEKNP